MMIAAWCLAGLFLAFYAYRKFWCHRAFKRHGIPGPEPHFLFGNSHQLWVNDRHLVLQKWTEKYGKVFGYFEGPRPILVISDLQMVEHVCTKQTSCFEGRLFAPVQPDSEKEPSNPLLNMMISKKNHWHRPRLAASPFFSPAKLQHIVPTIEKKITGILQVLDAEEKNGEAFDLREPFQRYAMDVLSDVAFGIELHLFDTDHEGHLPGLKVYEQAREMVHNGVVSSPAVFKAITVLPEIQPLAKLLVHFIMKFSSGPLSPLHGLLQLLNSTIEKRRSDSAKGCPAGRRNDLLQMLCDATRFVDKLTSSPVVTENKPAKPLVEDGRYLNEGQLKTNVVMFLMAGYETTSTTLAYLAHTLAMHPEAQEKLYDEICQFYPDPTTEMDYDTVMNKMTYLDWCCQETIRIYPEGINIINRFITEETSIRGYEIPKTMGSILVDVWSIHHDAELWGPVDPTEFYPERFSPDYPTSNRPRSAYLGFGIGPHHCIGMRYALLEMKMTMVRMLRRYRLLPPSADAPKRIPVKVMLVMVPIGDVTLKLVRRQS